MWNLSSSRSDSFTHAAQCLKPVEKWPKPPKNFLKMDKKKIFIWTYWWTESSKIQFLWLVFFKSMVKIEFENIWHTKLIFWTFPKKYYIKPKIMFFEQNFMDSPHSFCILLMSVVHQLCETIFLGVLLELWVIFWKFVMVWILFYG